MTIDIKLHRLGIFHYIVTWRGMKIRFYTRQGAVKFAREELLRYVLDENVTTDEVLMIAARYVDIGNHYDD